MKRLALTLVAVLLALPAFAGRSRDAARMAEADTLAADILHDRNVQNAIARSQFLGVEGIVADELAKHFREGDDKTRRDVAFALSVLAGPEHEAVLATLTRDVDGAVRMSAAKALGRIRAENPKPLVVLLTDKTTGARREAAKALGGYRNARFAPALLQAAQAEGEPEVRAAMLIAVGESGDKKLAKKIEPFLTSSSETTRFAAAQALCLLGSEEGFDFAKKKLASQDKFERREALDLFEGASAKIAGPFLRPLLKDPDPKIAARAARILHQGGEPKMLDFLVMQEWSSNGETKLAYEEQLDELKLTDADRAEILKKQGVK